MLVKQIHLLNLCILMQFTRTAVASREWAVWYKSEQYCVFKGSSVDFGCTYNYPADYRVKILKWIKQEPKHIKPVYHSDPEQVDLSYRRRTELANEDNNCTLRLHNVSESDVGKYYFCFYTGQAGSEGTYLNVAVLPFRVRLISNRMDGFIQEGDRVNLTCETENCTPSGEQITWFKDGVPLPLIKLWELRFNPVSPSDFGNYACGLNYSAISTAPHFLLDVRYSPRNVSLTAHSARLIHNGNTLTLICESSAKPPARTYSLFKMNGTDVFQIGWGHNYTVPVVGPGDSGQYFCLAQNALGSQNSTVITIRVQDSKDPDHLLFVRAALGALLFAGIVTVALLYLIKRRKQPSSSISDITENLSNTVLTSGLESSQSTGSLHNLQMPEATASERISDNFAVIHSSDTGISLS
ncbi:B-cell receptor CD22 isoform X1 [Pygocentrus nattereri]|uniref:Cd22 molecule n=1 Tax=Pygocentrus nattereri TaxID=42514 RepID=A0A3B4D8D8_PYGNA|nr:B-cell receptor CD22 isoform X1 [Pygocentrus nattereri]